MKNVLIFVALFGYSLVSQAQSALDKNIAVLDTQSHKERLDALRYAKEHLLNDSTIPNKKNISKQDFLNRVSDVAIAENDQGKTILNGEQLVSAYKEYSDKVLPSSKNSELGDYLGILHVYTIVLRDPHSLDELHARYPNQIDRGQPVAGDSRTLTAATFTYIVKQNFDDMSPSDAYASALKLMKDKCLSTNIACKACSISAR